MIIEEPADFLAAVARLQRGGPDAPGIVSDLLETIEHVKGNPASAYYRGRLSVAFQQGERELREMQAGERRYSDLSPPPSMDEVRLGAIQQFRAESPDEYWNDSELKAAERELIAKVNGTLTADARDDVAGMDELLADISEQRKDPNSQYNRDPQLRQQIRGGELALLEVKTGERHPKDLPPPPSRAESRLAEIRTIRRTDYDAFMKNDALRAEELGLLEQQQPTEQSDD